VSCKLCSSATDEDEAHFTCASHVVNRFSVRATYHQTDKVESSAEGARSTVLVTRSGEVSLDPSLCITLTPESLQHLNNVYAHALAVKVQFKQGLNMDACNPHEQGATVPASIMIARCADPSGLIMAC
jgi:hypothetical protein